MCFRSLECLYWVTDYRPSPPLGQFQTRLALQVVNPKRLQGGSERWPTSSSRRHLTVPVDPTIGEEEKYINPEEIYDAQDSVATAAEGEGGEGLTPDEQGALISSDGYRSLTDDQKNIVNEFATRHTPEEVASYLSVLDTEGFKGLEGTDTQPGGIDRKTGVLNYLAGHPDQHAQMEKLFGSDGFSDLYASGEEGKQSIDKLLRQYATDDAYRANIDSLIGSGGFQGLEGTDTQPGGVERQRGVLNYAANNPDKVEKLAALFNSGAFSELYGRGEEGKREVDRILRTYATNDDYRNAIDEVVSNFNDVNTRAHQADQLVQVQVE